MSERRMPDGSEWGELAKEVLDLWQEHLAALASDPRAREDMAKMMAPMGKAFSEWSAVMQHGFNAAKNGTGQPFAGGDFSRPTQPEPEPQPAPEESATAQPEAVGVASPDGDGGVDRIALRLAALERQLEELRSGLFGVAEDDGVAGAAEGEASAAFGQGSGRRPRKGVN